MWKFQKSREGGTLYVGKMAENEKWEFIANNLPPRVECSFYTFDKDI